jgi:hypothetical protein
VEKTGHVVERSMEWRRGSVGGAEVVRGMADAAGAAADPSSPPRTTNGFCSCTGRTKGASVVYVIDGGEGK